MSINIHFINNDQTPITAAAALQNQLSSIFRQLESQPVLEQTDTQTETTISGDCCITNFDISKQIPLWVLVEKEERGGNEITVFDFIQKYYDWLYCDLECGSGSNYLLEDKFLQVIDIEKTKERFLKRLYSTYFPEYRDDEELKDKNGNDVTIKSLSSFVKSIKTRFYLKKGTAEGLGIFFNKIFSVEDTNLFIKYPKKQILRLNGGAFYDSRFKFNAVTADRLLDPESVSNEIIGSRLNYNRFQDGGVFTDYSYILTTGLSAENYKNLHLRTNHPAGTNCIFELGINQYEPPGSTYIENQICELPRIGNYLPYQLNVDYVDAAYSLSGFYGLTYTIGCSLDPLAGSSLGNEPCFFFPSWAEETKDYESFFDIPIEKMFKICRINNINPNANIPLECT